LLSCLALLASAACTAPPTQQQMIDAGLVRLNDITPVDVWMVDNSMTEESKALAAAFESCRRFHDPTMGTAEGESDFFTRRDNKSGQLFSSAAVVVDPSARDGYFKGLDELLRCEGAAIEQVWERFSEGLDVVVRGPFPLPIQIAADRVDGRSLEVGQRERFSFIDVVVVVREQVVLTLYVVHEGEMTGDDLQQILEKPLGRLARL
jgi:hypothetical protein